MCEVHTTMFLDALASLDLKLSVSESFLDVFTASASTGLSDYFSFLFSLLFRGQWGATLVPTV